MLYTYIYITRGRKIFLVKYFTLFSFRYIAFGLIILGTGSLIFALPHFLSSKVSFTSDGEVGKNSGDIFSGDNDLCRSNGENIKVNETVTEVHHTTSSLAYYRYWFIFGQILHGIGAAPILTLGN